jgi:hypothetical protein
MRIKAGTPDRRISWKITGRNHVGQIAGFLLFNAEFVFLPSSYHFYICSVMDKQKG